MKNILSAHSILRVLQGKEVTMATSYRFRGSEWTLGKISPLEHHRTGCLESVAVA